MPISALQWEHNLFRDFDGSRDRHVLRSESSGSLLDAGNVQFVLEDGGEESAGDYLAANNDVEIEFQPLFRSQKALNRYSGFGIHVDADTGIVSFDPGPRPANAPRNFLLKVFVRKNAGGKRSPANIEPLLLRVHVHESVRQIWLTPETMTLHVLKAGEADDTLSHFTALAEFDDDTVGDVTSHHGLSWSTPAFADSHVDADGFVTIFGSEAPGTTIAVKATTTAAWGSKSGQADVFIAPPWSVGAPIVATLVEGPPAAFMTVPMQADLSANVLFLGIGFPNEDNDVYETMIADICTRMKRDRLTRPYDLLSASMNFWRARAPAATRGITVRCEVFVTDDAARAKPLTAAIAPQAGVRWKVPQLMYAVGRPIPADMARDIAGLRDEFTKRCEPEWALDLNDAKTVTGDVIGAWQLQGRRMFIDAVDSFPPLVVGSPPSMQNDTSPPMMNNPTGFRGAVRHIDAFFKSIVSGNGATVAGGQALGNVWVGEDFAFDNRKLVVMTGADSVGRPNFEDSVLLALPENRNELWNTQPAPGRKAVRLHVSQADLPFSESRALWRTAAHELAHALFLGDEYPDAPTTLKEGDDPTGTLFDLVPNVLSLDSVSKPPAAGASRIDGDLIKWRWPRIQHAAVIAAAISEAGGTFTVPVKALHAFQFKAGMKVRLRARTPGVPLKRFTPGTEVSTGEFVVASPPAGAGDSLALQLVSGMETLGSLGRFAPGSLVFEPVPPPAGISPNEYPFAELLTIGVRKWLTARGPADPLLTCSPLIEYVARSKTQLPDFDAFPFTFSPRNNARLIGLYKSGGGFACGTYHPAGLCMMRNDVDTDEFCAVCRYALVDLIDPTVHGDIELDLAARNFE